jgi:hypothetical protein
MGADAWNACTEGVAFGLAIGNVGLGIALGLAIGASLYSSQKKKAGGK